MLNFFRKRKFVPLELLPVSASQFCHSSDAWKVEMLYRNGKSGIESAQLIAELYLEKMQNEKTPVTVDYDLLVLLYFNNLTKGSYSLS